MEKIRRQAVRDDQPGHGRSPGHVSLRDEGRVGRRRSRGERRVREMAEDPGTSTRRNAPRGSADLSTEKGGTWSHRDHGNGKVIAEGRGDVQEVIDFYEYAAGEGRRM